MTLTNAIHQLKFVSLGLPNVFQNVDEIFVISGKSLNELKSYHRQLVKNGEAVIKFCQFREDAVFTRARAFSKFDPLNDFFKRRASDHFKA